MKNKLMPFYDRMMLRKRYLSSGLKVTTNIHGNILNLSIRPFGHPHEDG